MCHTIPVHCFKRFQTVLLKWAMVVSESESSRVIIPVILTHKSSLKSHNNLFTMLQRVMSFNCHAILGTLWVVTSSQETMIDFQVLSLLDNDHHTMQFPNPCHLLRVGLFVIC